MALGDVGGLQEMSDLEDRQTIMRVAQELNYGWYMPVNGGGGAIPIVWNRNRFLLIDGRSVMVHPGEEDVTPARFIDVVRLREVATGKVSATSTPTPSPRRPIDAQATDMHLIPRLRLRCDAARRDPRPGRQHRARLRRRRSQRQLPRRPAAQGGGAADLGARRHHQLRHAAAGLARPTSLLDYGMSLKPAAGCCWTGPRSYGDFNSDHDAVRLPIRPSTSSSGTAVQRPARHGRAEERRAGPDGPRGDGRRAGRDGAAGQLTAGRPGAEEGAAGGVRRGRRRPGRPRRLVVDGSGARARGHPGHRRRGRVVGPPLCRDLPGRTRHHRHQLHAGQQGGRAPPT